MPSKKYADVSLFDHIGLLVQLIKLPLILSTTLLLSPFTWHTKHKSWRRVLSDKAFRWAANLPMAQLQYLFGTSQETYEKTVTKMGMQVVVEELDHNAKLMWIGPKRSDRVLLYLHGGAFVAPVEYIAIYFWQHVQQQIKNKSNGFDLGIVILNYTLIPESPFPTPLLQSVTAINHLITTSGVNPSNLHLAGDSAGGNLVLQVLFHAMRPLPSSSIPPLNLPSPIGGAYLISPWVTLTADTGSHSKFSDSDIISQTNLCDWGQLVLADVPPEQRGYVEALKAPDEWFAHLGGVVQRILITAGGQECLKEDIVAFHEKVKKALSEVGEGNDSGVDLRFVVQNGGVHNDMFMDFLAGEKVLGELTPMIVDWLAAGYDV